MQARDFMEMNRERANRAVEENKHHPRSQGYLLNKAILAFINAYEMVVGYESKARHSRGYWENVPLVEAFEYVAVHESGEQGCVYDIEKRHVIGVELDENYLVEWSKDEIVELRIKRKSES